MDKENKEEKLSFEDSMKRLEEIANELEKDDLTLDESIAKFEEGMKLSKDCKEMLTSAEKKITILVGDKEENFTAEE
jgi:exodeoxyribonuclease VII small subunit